MGIIINQSGSKFVDKHMKILIILNIYFNTQLMWGRSLKWRKTTKRTQKWHLKPRYCFASRPCGLQLMTSTWKGSNVWLQLSHRVKHKLLKSWFISEERTGKKSPPLFAGSLASKEIESQAPSLVHRGLPKVCLCVCVTQLK